MNMTRDIVIDLLPVYHSGDASADTRALVEEYLAQDAEFARLVQRITQGLDAAPVGPPPEAELRALERTRALIRKRTTLVGLASAFTLMPFSFAASGNRLVWAMWRDAPAMAGAFLVAAAGLWIAWFTVNRRLRVSGV